MLYKIKSSDKTTRVKKDLALETDTNKVRYYTSTKDYTYIDNYVDTFNSVYDLVSNDTQETEDTIMSLSDRISSLEIASPKIYTSSNVDKVGITKDMDLTTVYATLPNNSTLYISASWFTNASTMFPTVYATLIIVKGSSTRASIELVGKEEPNKVYRMFLNSSGSDLAGTWVNVHHKNATATTDGLMSATDKTKLDGIATGANKYTLPTASSSTLGGVKTGSNITNSSGTISLTKDNVVAALGYTPPTKDTNTTYSAFVKSGENAAAGLVPKPSTTAGTTKYLREDGTWAVPPNTTYSAATTSANGLMSAADKSKLNGITISNYLPLGGGTMTGAITYATNFHIQESTDVGGNVDVGWDFTSRAGAGVGLRSVDHATNPGWFSIYARDASNSTSLTGKPNGVLTWGGKNLVTSVNSVNANASGNTVLTLDNFSTGKIASKLYVGNKSDTSNIGAQSVNGIFTNSSVDNNAQTLGKNIYSNLNICSWYGLTFGTTEGDENSTKLYPYTSTVGINCRNGDILTKGNIYLNPGNGTYTQIATTNNSNGYWYTEIHCNGNSLAGPEIYMENPKGSKTTTGDILLRPKNASGTYKDFWFKSTGRLGLPNGEIWIG